MGHKPLQVSQNLPTPQDIEKVAELPVLTVERLSKPFKSLYEGNRRVLVIFIRHFFCGHCQEYIRTISTSLSPGPLHNLSTPTSIVIIGCGQPDLIPFYTSTTSCPFTIYADPSRALYDHLGMVKCLNLGQKNPDYIKHSLSYNVVRSMWQGITSGRNANKGGDFGQVGGEFLFEDGEIKWCHRMENTRDHPEVVELRRVLGLDSDSKLPTIEEGSS